MGRPRKSNILVEFERVRKPDFKKLAEITWIAKGHRRAYEFALVCGVNASTISRILNWEQMKSPISDELLISIAANAEEHNGSILQMLLDAHGVIPRRGMYIDDYDRFLQCKMRQLTYHETSYGVADRPYENKTETQTVRNAREIVQNELISQHLGIRAVDVQTMPVIMPQSSIMPFSCDFAIEIIDSASDQRPEIRAYLVLDGTLQKGIARLEHLFSMAYLYSPLSPNIRYIAVLFDSSMFSRIREELKNCRITDSISFMLIDIRTRKTTDYFQIPIS